ncbi:MarR family transcriptional regulator [Salinarchaeum sp. IM2453]|uniref:helix-turn-helix domain-containing protein n=1 Tax=Salinarchaeum sp. IM2453 TaxID=2862870 RepID=UPI001C831677|nr:helix-turn-helix domain-containing protein [Salinarchaeum sp. IM2453]QZA87932.1 MarR family transcriptional regulator [Salinarchaeum sp. IM2453]
MMAALDTEDRRVVMSKIESATAKLVYHSLALEGAATASQLQQRLDLPQLTILSILQTLSNRELVACESTDETTRYYAKRTGI